MPSKTKHERRTPLVLPKVPLSAKVESAVHDHLVKRQLQENKRFSGYVNERLQELVAADLVRDKYPALKGKTLSDIVRMAASNLVRSSNGRM